MKDDEVSRALRGAAYADGLPGYDPHVADVEDCDGTYGDGVAGEFRRIASLVRTSPAERRVLLHLADTYVAQPNDDDEPVTEAWFRKEFGGTYKEWGRRSLHFVSYGTVDFTLTVDGRGVDNEHDVAELKTRGHVRAVAAILEGK